MNEPNAYQKLQARVAAKELADQQFLNRVELYAIDRIVEHVEPRVHGKWHFSWNTSATTLGYCDYRKKEVSLSKGWTLATPWEEIVDTILHEIAHVLTPFDIGHGESWKKVAARIGAKPERTYKGSVSVRDVAQITWEMVDTTTGNVVREYIRKPNAKTFARISNYYMPGRKVETKGKLILRQVDLIKELGL